MPSISKKFAPLHMSLNTLLNPRCKPAPLQMSMFCWLNPMCRIASCHMSISSEQICLASSDLLHTHLALAGTHSNHDCHYMSILMRMLSLLSLGPDNNHETCCSSLPPTLSSIGTTDFLLMVQLSFWLHDVIEQSCECIVVLFMSALAMSGCSRPSCLNFCPSYPSIHPSADAHDPSGGKSAPEWYCMAGCPGLLWKYARAVTIESN